MLYVGIDLHKKYSTFCVTNKEGTILDRTEILNEEEEILKYLKGFNQKKRLVVEATFAWEWLIELLQAREYDVCLAHPLKVKAIASAKVKTDKIDATTLARLLRADLIPTSYIPPKRIRWTRELLRHRQSLVRKRTSSKNRIRATLNKANIKTPHKNLWTKKGRKFLEEVKLTKVKRLIIDGQLALIDTINKELKKVEKEIGRLACKTKEVELLLTIPGVGRYLALLIYAEVGEIERFLYSEQLSSYAGLISSVYSSGDIIYFGRITKEGSSYLRYALVEIAMHLSKKGGPLSQFYRRIEKKKGSKKARVALARKICTYIFYMLKKGITFEENLEIVYGVCS